MDQSNKLRFSTILDSFTLFGRTLWPLWMPHRRATCAGDLFSFSEISMRIGSFKISPFTQLPGDPNGEYACTHHPIFYVNLCVCWLLIANGFRKCTERWTPVDLQRLWSAGCCQTGWHSTWLTAGGTFAVLSKSWSFFVEKLLTPMALACPDAYNPSIAFHVSAMHNGAMTSGANPLDPGFVLNGQCTWNKHVTIQDCL